MQGEDLLTAHAVRDPANGDGLADAAVLPGDDGAFKHLDTLTGAFLDAHMHTNGVADLSLGQLLLHVLAVQSLNQIHIFVLLKRLGVHAVKAAAEDSP